MSEEHSAQEKQPAPGGSEQGPLPEDVSGKALSDALRVSFAFLKVAMVGLVVVYLLQGFFYVGRDEVRVRLRFGRPVKMSRGAGRGKGYVIDSESGWHYCWPWEEVVSIPLSEQTLDLRGEFWFGRGMPKGQEQPSDEKGGLSVKTDGYLISGDVNIIHIQLRARYRARDDEQGALDYAFRYRGGTAGQQASEGALGASPTGGPSELLRRFLIGSTIETVASWGVLEVRRKRRVVGTGELELFAEIEKRVREKLRRFEESNGFSAGIELSSIERIEDPRVPEEVKPSFDMAQEAESEKERLKSEAQKMARSIVENAEGEKAKMVEEARAYKKRVAAIVEADALTLKNLLPVYRSSPQKAAILREWFYGRMVEELLGQAKGSFVLHRPSEGSNTEIRFLLSRPLEKAVEEEQPEHERH